MRVTYKGDYALKALLCLSLNHGKEVITIHEVARQIDAPIKFLEQVLLDLKKGGFVESRRGKVGGYRLSREPFQITIGQVVRYIDGPIDPVMCVRDDYSKCEDIRKCVFRSVWKDVARATSDIIDNITFEDLVRRIKSSDQAPVYSI